MFLTDEHELEAAVAAGVIDCATCEITQRVTALDAGNLDAWDRYRRLTGHRLVFDTQAGNWWFGHVLRDVDPDDLDDVMARLRVLYDTFAPPKTGS